VEIWSLVGKDEVAQAELDIPYPHWFCPAWSCDIGILTGPASKEEGAHCQVGGGVVSVVAGPGFHAFEGIDADCLLSFGGGIQVPETGELPR
jgi:hypothetical protein